MTGINVYFYRKINPTNVLMSWSDCVAVPRVGDVVELGNRPECSTWRVEAVTWSHPTAEAQVQGAQVVDVLLTIITPAP